MAADGILKFLEATAALWPDEAAQYRIEQPCFGQRAGHVAACRNAGLLGLVEEEGGRGRGLHRSNILRRQDCKGAFGRRLRPVVGAAGASRRRRPAALQGCAKRELPGKRCAPKSRLRGGVWLAPGHLSQRALLTGPQLAREEHEDLRLDSLQHHLREAPSEEEARPPAQQPRGACPNAKRQRKTIMKNGHDGEAATTNFSSSPTPTPLSWVTTSAETLHYVPTGAVDHLTSPESSNESHC
ncbi:uncharacterized protein LOC126235261 [Schistocerca nitens]|uniref:uncharacterized protein LOC126235261 n=1 Tax=Schistocerca nitens TaxID=7011 RepID=UPI002119AEF1|nr:uncharacterized protein LOC126235261 [Schistocerca nitens]